MAMFLYAAVCAAPAYGATTCAAGRYLNGDTCTLCPVGTYKDTTGPQECTPCPPIDETTLHTTIPDTCYPYDLTTDTYIKTSGITPVITEYASWRTGIQALTDCQVVYRYYNAAGRVSNEYVYYNPTTGKYDVNDGIMVSYLAVNPGYYLDTRYMSATYCNVLERSQAYVRAIICSAGYYCPGVTQRSCADGAYEAERGRTICPVGHYCPAGASAPTPCPVGTYSDTTGASTCNPCTNAPQNASYIGNATTNSCPWECDNGYVQRGNECAQLCTAGMQHLKTGNGLQFNLYRVAYSSPALHVKQNNTICYGILAPGGASNAINIKYNGQIYHMAD